MRVHTPRVYPVDVASPDHGDIRGVDSAAFQKRAGGDGVWTAVRRGAAEGVLGGAAEGGIVGGIGGAFREIYQRTAHPDEPQTGFGRAMIRGAGRGALVGGVVGGITTGAYMGLSKDKENALKNFDIRDDTVDAYDKLRDRLTARQDIAHHALHASTLGSAAAGLYRRSPPVAAAPAATVAGIPDESGQPKAASTGASPVAGLHTGAPDTDNGGTTEVTKVEGVAPVAPPKPKDFKTRATEIVKGLSNRIKPVYDWADRRGITVSAPAVVLGLAGSQLGQHMRANMDPDLLIRDKDGNFPRVLHEFHADLGPDDIPYHTRFGIGDRTLHRQAEILKGLKPSDSVSPVATERFMRMMGAHGPDGVYKSTLPIGGRDIHIQPPSNANDPVSGMGRSLRSEINRETLSQKPPSWPDEVHTIDYDGSIPTLAHELGHAVGNTKLRHDRMGTLYDFGASSEYRPLMERTISSGSSIRHSLKDDKNMSSLQKGVVAGTSALAAAAAAAPSLITLAEETRANINGLRIFKGTGMANATSTYLKAVAPGYATYAAAAVPLALTAGALGVVSGRNLRDAWRNRTRAGSNVVAGAGSVPTYAQAQPPKAPETHAPKAASVLADTGWGVIAGGVNGAIEGIVPGLAGGVVRNVHDKLLRPDPLDMGTAAMRGVGEGWRTGMLGGAIGGGLSAGGRAIGMRNMASAGDAIREVTPYVSGISSLLHAG